MKITRAKFQSAVSACIRDLFMMHDDVRDNDKQLIVALANDNKIRVTKVCDYDFAVTLAIHLLQTVRDSGEISKADLLAHVLTQIDEA